MDCSKPDSSVLHFLPEFAEIHVQQKCYLTTSSFAVPFSFCLQSFPGSESFPLSQLFLSGGQSIGASALATVLLMNIQGWFPLGLTDLILQSKGLSRVFSSSMANLVDKFSFSFG